MGGVGGKSRWTFTAQLTPPPCESAAHSNAWRTGQRAQDEYRRFLYNSLHLYKPICKLMKKATRGQMKTAAEFYLLLLPRRGGGEKNKALTTSITQPHLLSFMKLHLAKMVPTFHSDHHYRTYSPRLLYLVPAATVCLATRLSESRAGLAFITRSSQQHFILHG